MLDDTVDLSTVTRVVGQCPVKHYRIATDEQLLERGGQLALLSLPLAWDVDGGATA